MKHAKTHETRMPEEAVMRQAVANKDRSFDGVFIYGVLTTAVYCKPSCASRAANPANIRFFKNTAAAAAAGLRACKRCRPHEASDRHSGLMVDLAKYIDSHADAPLSLGTLAEQAQLSPTHLQRIFKAAMGVSPKAYHDAARMRLLKGALKSGKGVLESITDAGFQSTSRVYGQATRTLGMTPSTYRSGAAGENIVYAFRQTVLGPLLMAATHRGVCFAQFGRTEKYLIHQLQAEFPKATVHASDATHSGALNAWIEALDAHLVGKTACPEIPLDLRGTAFQIRVWRFLLGVPDGDLVSYQELASGIGAPKAVRAAASGCAANRIAVLVPCHRVLRNDGGLGGYRWGLDRKRLLIDHERARRAICSP